ncbi:extracellular solute-binding protein [Streptomyces sp. MBT62]|uniref:ABC transporter substrate-binding protein n=1 Tax=Streptomyces sp. MBT62 TaxID=2800410 RepID=UPI00190D6A6F|nr:extracellular solute-binding protein [Streptomyces sp. MBT62]MBK3568266.1 extracellular solute-binding protein [Streptomyces sp. MBT62]
MSNHDSATSPRPARLPFASPTASRGQWPAPRRRRLAAIALTMATALTAAACSSSGGSTDAAKGPVTLTFWVKSPFPDGKVLIDQWNKLHPDIHIKLDVVSASGNTIPQAKLLLDVKAHREPDVAIFDTEYLPQFVTTGSVLNLNTVKDGDASALSSKFESWAWSTVHVGDGLYGLPIDAGPLNLYYRKDLFAKYHLQVPKTMAEYVQAAEALHKKDPSVYLADLPTNDASVFTAMAWAAGAKPFKVKGNSWVVDIAGAESLKAAKTWQQLIDDKSVMTLPQFSSEWSQAYNTGKLASWMSAAWAPGPLKSFAPKTAGKWAVAPMPQSTPGVASSGSWGGSSAVVFKSTKYPEQALEFTKFLTTNQQVWSEYWIPKITLYPTNIDAQKSEALSKPDSFFGGQKIYDTISASNHSVAHDFNYGPVANEWFTTEQNYLSQAVNGKMTVAEALQQTQKSVVSYMRKQGLSVEAP